MEAVVCGLDPGLAITGYAVLRARGPHVLLLDAGVCRFDKKLPLPERLAAIECDVRAVLTEHKPDLIAVEELYAHYKHPRTAILMGHARGVILLAAANLGLKVRGYAATRVKRYLTGNGHATKGQVQRAVQRMLGLGTPPDPPDVADALAIAMCGADDLMRREMPKVRV
jgi:crossover junction endodeoxyribonuclease RuvC